MCNWVTMLYSRKLTEHCKPAIMEKIKIIKNFNKKQFVFFEYMIHLKIVTQQRIPKSFLPEEVVEQQVKSMKPSRCQIIS